jgi:predicted esterase
VRQVLALSVVAFLGAVLLTATGCRDAMLKPEVPLEYQFALPDNFDPEYEYPLLIVLHDSGGNEYDMFRAWDLGWFDRPDFIMLAIRAPFRAEDGFAWVRRTDASDPGARYENQRGSALTSAVRLVAAVDELEQEYAIDPGWVFVLGLGQAADIALFSALRDPDYFSGAAALHGAFDTTLLAPQNFAAIERLELFFALPRDSSEQGRRAERLWEMLEPYEMDVKFDHRAGTRAYTREVCRAVQDFFGLTATEKGEEVWPEEDYHDAELIEE